MDNLEYELSGQKPSRDRRQDFVVEVKQKEEEQSQDAAIEFSIAIINALEEDVKTHNENNSSKVTLHQLKTVFCNAIKEYVSNDEVSNTAWAFARVNVYLRIVSGGQSEAPNTINTSKKSNLIEISADWLPSELDIENAKNKIKKNSLNHRFDTLDDLYLNFQPLQWQID